MLVQSLACSFQWIYLIHIVYCLRFRSKCLISETVGFFPSRFADNGIGLTFARLVLFCLIYVLSYQSSLFWNVTAHVVCDTVMNWKKTVKAMERFLEPLAPNNVWDLSFKPTYPQASNDPSFDLPLKIYLYLGFPKRAPKTFVLVLKRECCLLEVIINILLLNMIPNFVFDSDGSFPKDEGSSQEVTNSLFVGESKNYGFLGGQNKYWGTGGIDSKNRTLPRNR